MGCSKISCSHGRELWRIVACFWVLGFRVSAQGLGVFMKPQRFAVYVCTLDTSGPLVPGRVEFSTLKLESPISYLLENLEPSGTQNP